MIDKTILLVDDDEALTALLGAGLSDEGFTVVCAHDGNQALVAFKQSLPDLVILDLMLPGLDGQSVCRTIRRSSAVPIIMLTARQDEVDRVVGLEIGADDYVTKPFSFKELLARIKSALRRPDMTGYGDDGNGDILVVGDLSIDLAQREVRVRDMIVVLPLKEFELLATLAARPGRVFERDELLCRVWGDDFYGEQKTLDVHIRRLRSRIEQDPSDPKYILTMRGVGYRLVGGG